MVKKIIKKYSKQADSFPTKFFENLRIYSDDSDWLATDLFPAWSGFGATKPNNWVLLGEEDIKEANLVDPEDESFGWVVHTHKDDSYFTMMPGMSFNKGMEVIVKEARRKM